MGDEWPTASWCDSTGEWWGQEWYPSVFATPMCPTTPKCLFGERIYTEVLGWTQIWNDQCPYNKLDLETDTASPWQGQKTQTQGKSGATAQHQEATRFSLAALGGGGRKGRERLSCCLACGLLTLETVDDASLLVSLHLLCDTLLPGQTRFLLPVPHPFPPKLGGALF